VVWRNILPHPAALKLDVAEFSETLEHSYQTAYCHIPKTVTFKIVALACESELSCRYYSVDPSKMKTNLNYI
jgi:hypothetical protein